MEPIYYRLSFLGYGSERNLSVFYFIVGASNYAATLRLAFFKTVLFNVEIWRPVFTLFVYTVAVHAECLVVFPQRGAW